MTNTLTRAALKAMPTEIERLRERHTKRFKAIAATMPLTLALQPRRRERSFDTINLAVAQLGRRGLARVVWPWQKQPTPEVPGAALMSAGRRRRAARALAKDKVGRGRVRA